MQVINQIGNGNQTSRVNKELKAYLLRIHQLRSQSQKILNNLQQSAEKKRANHIGAAVLTSDNELNHD